MVGDGKNSEIIVASGEVCIDMAKEYGVAIVMPRLKNRVLISSSHIYSNIWET